jgi:type IV pilus assembly protein PilC
MLFKYEALTKEGEMQRGAVDALNKDSAVSAVQQRGLTIVSIKNAEKKSVFRQSIFISKKVPTRELVVLSRQLSTLFAARVPVLKAFQLLTGQVENTLLRQTLGEITSDIQGGMQIADALEKHPFIFSEFYVNMVRVGEESGKIAESFTYLADYLRRSYDLTLKARSALIYPLFVVVIFAVVMIVLLMFIFPKLTVILKEVGQEIPIYTKIVIAISDFLLSFGVYILIVLLGGGFWFWQFSKTDHGKVVASRLKLSLPVIGPLVQKLYLSRIADSMYTMLTSGSSLVRTLEIASKVVGDAVYKQVAASAANEVKTGGLVSEAFEKHDEIPGIMIQIIKAGEETGELGTILKTLSEFYQREVYSTVDAFVGLIEPVLIVLLGLAVGLVIGSVLIPIYSISTGF